MSWSSTEKDRNAVSSDLGSKPASFQVKVYTRFCTVAAEVKFHNRTFLKEQCWGTKAGSILTLFPHLVSPPLLLNRFLALTGRKKQNLSWGESKVQRTTCDFLNGTFIFEFCVVIGWLQEAGTSCLNVVGSDHSLWKVKDLLSVCVNVCGCVLGCCCVSWTWNNLWLSECIFECGRCLWVYDCFEVMGVLFFSQTSLVHLLNLNDTFCSIAQLTIRRTVFAPPLQWTSPMLHYCLVCKHCCSALPGPLLPHRPPAGSDYRFSQEVYYRHSWVSTLLQCVVTEGAKTRAETLIIKRTLLFCSMWTCWLNCTKT